MIQYLAELARPDDYVVVHVGEGRAAGIGEGFELLKCLPRVSALLDVVIASVADWTRAPSEGSFEDVWFSMSMLVNQGVVVKYEL